MDPLNYNTEQQVVPDFCRLGLLYLVLSKNWRHREPGVGLPNWIWLVFLRSQFPGPIPASMLSRRITTNVIQGTNGTVRFNWNFGDWSPDCLLWPDGSAVVRIEESPPSIPA